MKIVDINPLLTETYLQLLKNLSPDTKLDLIAKLTQSVKADMKENSRAFEKSFGAWQSREDAEEIIDTIRSSRQINRQIEEL